MSEWKIAKERPEDKPGTITQVAISKIEIKTGSEIFGPSAKNADRKFVHMYAQRRGKDVPIGNVALPEDPSEVHPKSNAAKFVGLYEHAPKVGLKVQVKVTADGFWQLVL